MERLTRKYISMMFVFFIMFWNLLPIGGYAFSFAIGSPITPGIPITPGTPGSIGTPMERGTFMIPGEVYSPGQHLQSGEKYDAGSSIPSGTFIVETLPLTKGTFIIPNAPGSYGMIYPSTGLSINLGNASQVGTGVSSGQGFEQGNGVSSGESNLNGQSVNAGQINPMTGLPYSVGTGVTSGQGIEQGNDVIAGQNNANGQSVNIRMIDPKTGLPVQSGDLTSGKDNIQGGNNPVIGNATNNGVDPNLGMNTPNGLSLLYGPHNPANGLPFQSGDVQKNGDGNEPGTLNNVLNWMKNEAIASVKEYKRFGTDIIFAIDDIAQGYIAHKAGYKFVEHKGGFKLEGNRKVDGKIKQWFLDRYSSNIKDNKRNYNDFTKKEFLKGKGLAGIKESISKAISNKFLPFQQKLEQIKIKGHKNPKIESKWTFNKSILEPKNLIKGSAPVNFVLTTGQTWLDYTVGEKKSQFNTTEFYADLSTDITIGAGVTLASSIGASMAVGAAGGSIVPGAGTAAGAVAGLGVGLISYGLLNTGPGRRLQSNVKDGYVYVYNKGSDVINIGINKVSKFGSSVKSRFKKLGGLFGQ